MSPDAASLGDVAVIARQSTKKTRQSESIPRQRELLEIFAAQIGWPYPQHPRRFYEAMTSGMSPHRPELERLVEDIRSGQVRRVLVDDVSRVSRSVLMSTGLLSVIEKHKAALAVRSFHRVLDLGADTDHALASIGFLFSETFWMQHARGIRDGMRRLAAHGRWLTSIPFGFRKRAGILEPDPKTAPALVRQFELCRLHGFREASRILEREGNRVSPSTLAHRFKNPVYRGILQYGATRMESLKNNKAKLGELSWRGKKPCEEETIYLERAFQSPVSERIFEDEPQERESRLKNKNGTGIRGDGAAFLLSGLSRCSLCGKNICAHSTPRRRPDGVVVRYEYAGCRTPGCPNATLPRARLERRFDAAISRLLGEPGTLRLGLISTLHRSVAEADRRRPTLETEREKISQSLERLQGAYRDEMASDELLVKELESLKADRAAITQNLGKDQRLRELAAAPNEARQALVSWMQDFQSIRNTASRRDIALFLRRALIRVEVGANLRMSLLFRRALPATPTN